MTATSPTPPPVRPVDFLIAGVQKGGTNSLNAYLEQHPDVWMPPVHDPHFFDSDENFSGPTIDYFRYHACFERPHAGCLLGEATPIYLYWPEAMRRIYSYNAAMKLIVLLRNPIERAWSHWRMEYARGDETLLFGAAIRYERDRARTALPGLHRVYSYVDRGFYSEQIRRVRRYFRDDRILFIKSERLFARPAEVTAETMRFLGLAPVPVDTSEVHYAGIDQGQIPVEDKAFLLDAFRKDIELTASLLGWDCADWLS